MNIFVTGATGFVGGYFVNEALSRGHNITGLIRVGSKPKIALTGCVNWQPVELDKITSNDLASADVLVHFASVGVSPQKSTWEELYFWNVMVLLRLLEAAASAGIRKIVIAGSFIEYGLSADDYDLIPVTAALRPTTPYAASKASGFALAHSFCLNNSISLVYKRIFSAYGIGQYQGNFWPSLRAAALGGEDFPMTLGEQIRDFISVEKVAQQFMDSVESEIESQAMPIVENVCSGEGQTIVEFAKYWWVKWKAKGSLRQGAVKSRGNEPIRFVGEPPQRGRFQVSSATVA
jgi:nucleoside-diphosphate-sugar epimerase